MRNITVKIPLIAPGTGPRQNADGSGWPEQPDYGLWAKIERAA
jgi:hypothetical protein